MYRTFMNVLLAGLMLSMTDAGGFAAPTARASASGPGKANASNNSGQKNAGRRGRRAGHGMLHIQVRAPGGRRASGAIVRVISRGRGRRRQVVRRANRAGRVNVSLEARSYVVRARGVHGARGSSGASVGAGGRAGVMVQLHGGRRGTAVIGASVRGHGFVGRRHERHGLGVIASHHARHAPAKATTPGATLTPQHGGPVSPGPVRP